MFHMNSLKKYPIFWGLLIILVLAFLAGAVYTVMLNIDLGQVDRNMSAAASRYEKARQADPSAAEVAVSEKNIKTLEDKLDFLVADLSRSESAIIKKLPYAQGFELQNGLRDMVNRWKNTAAKNGIKLKADMDFSFRRYYVMGSDAPKEDAIASLWRQACVLDYILGKLFSSKPKDKEMTMGIVSVARENLKEEGINDDPRARGAAARQRADEGEIFRIDPQISARTAGSIDTLAYRFEFTGQTEVLRLFLNQLKSFDAMLVVRSVEVRPEEHENDLYMANAMSEDGVPAAEAPLAFDSFSGFAAPAAPTSEVEEFTAQEAAANTPIITNNTSRFTVVIEYLEVVKEAPAPAKEEKKADSEE